MAPAGRQGRRRQARLPISLALAEPIEKGSADAAHRAARGAVLSSMRDGA
jgi:hypothetical protein